MNGSLITFKQEKIQHRPKMRKQTKKLRLFTDPTAPTVPPNPKSLRSRHQD